MPDPTPTTTDVAWKLVAEACRGAAPLDLIADRLLTQGWLPPAEADRLRSENAVAVRLLLDLTDEAAQVVNAGGLIKSWEYNDFDALRRAVTEAADLLAQLEADRG